MNLYTFRRRASLVIVGAALLFLADLFLPWQKVAVEVAGVVDVDETASGWSGWGAIAGVLALVLVVLGLDQARAATETPRRALTTALLALGVFGTTTLAVFTGQASVQSAPVGVEVHSTLWPARIAFALAIVIAAAAFVPLLGTESVERGPRGLPPHEAA